MIRVLLALLVEAANAEPAAFQPLPEPRPRPVLPPLPRHGTTGYRAVMPAGGHTFTSRLLFVGSAEGPQVGEVTLGGQLAWRSFSVSAEVLGTAAWSERWSGAGMGNTVLNVRGILGRKVTHALGVRASIATGARPATPLGDVAWWGAIASATVPTNTLSLSYEGATERWVWQVFTGTDLDWLGLPAGGTAVATVQPVAPGWFFVGEAELIFDPAPVHVRTLVRRDFGGGWQADLGFALPFVALADEAIPTVLGQVQRRW